MNARLNLGITFQFVSGRRMVKVVIGQIFMALHQGHQLRDSSSTFEVYHLLWTRVFEGRINTEKDLEVRDEYPWPTVQRYFADGRYILQEDNSQGEFGEKVLPREKYYPHLMANVFSRLITDR